MNNNEQCQKVTCEDYRKAIEFIGKRWTGTIIYNLLNGPKRYHELLNSIEGISDRLLTERLKDLEKEQLVIRNIIDDSPRKVEYKLTKAGRDFESVIKAISNWIQKKNKAN